MTQTSEMIIVPMFTFFVSYVLVAIEISVSNLNVLDCKRNEKLLVFYTKFFYYISCPTTVKLEYKYSYQ